MERRLTVDKKLCRLEKPQITKVSSYVVRRDSSFYVNDRCVTLILVN